MWVARGEKNSLLSLVAQLSSEKLKYQKKKTIILHDLYFLFKKTNSSVQKGGEYKSII